jgi:nicotinamidase-related amidase
MKFCLAAIALMAGAPVADAAPATIIDEWSHIAIPAPPALETVTVDPEHTALLVLDMAAVNCTEAKRPRCVRSIPSVRHLLDAARAHHALVVYSAGQAVPGTPAHPPVAELAPLPDEPLVQAPVDKFVTPDLARILAEHKITTVIVTGTSAEGAVLYTASGAALRGIKAVVPVDTWSAVEPFAELYSAWHLKNAPAALSKNIVLSRSDLVSWK